MAKKLQPSVDRQKELKEQTALADAGEAAGVFLHEVGNVLNNLLLDAKLMQRELPDEHRDRLDESCELITEAARQMKELAQYRQSCRIVPYPIDLNAQVKEIVAQIAHGTDGLQTALDNDLPQLSTTIADLNRLLRLLIHNAVSSSGKNCVQIRTATEEGHVKLTVEISGAFVKPDQLPSLFEPFQSVLPGWNNLELAICRNLVRRMNGRIQADLGKDGGFLVTIYLPCPD